LPRSVGCHAALKHDMPALPFVPPELVGKRLLMLVAMWLEDAEAPEGAELIDRLRSVGNPAVSAVTVLRWDDPGCDADYMQRTRTVVRDLAPWVGQGVYFNMLNVDELDRVVEALGGPAKYAKLGRVKARYDTENLFRANYNIVPVSES
ncbi:MAG TPA: BBE domain-containing protein, partial [Streptosporangiaceae bacterium]|nr:BBE domain-containing protein [Streptosporangiaceae bacterium]